VAERVEEIVARQLARSRPAAADDSTLQLPSPRHQSATGSAARPSAGGHPTVADTRRQRRRRST
jgi:hypothetical protein